MPVFGQPKVYPGKNNLVRNPPSLPVPLALGSLSWSVRLEGFPSGSITYRAVRLNELNVLMAAYDPCRTLRINGIPFLVSDFAYQRQEYLYKPLPFDLYEVSISLKGRWEAAIAKNVRVFDFLRPDATEISISDLARAAGGVPYRGRNFKIPIPENSDRDYKISMGQSLSTYAPLYGCWVDYTNGAELVKLSGRGNRYFSHTDITSDGSNQISIFPIYRDTELTWGNSDAPDTAAGADGFPDAPEFTLQEPKIEKTVEEDDQPTQVPAETRVLRTLDSDHRKNGPKKRRTETTKWNGTLLKEKNTFWGFEYNAIDGEGGGDPFVIVEPQGHWRIVEEQVTTPIYQKLPAIVLKIKAKDPDPRYARTNLSGFVNLVVHPDYERFVETTFGGAFGRIAFKLNVEYLTEQVTRGTKRFSFRDESGTETLELTGTGDPLDAALLELYQPKNLSSEGRTTYFLKSARSYYGEEVGNPFSVQWYDYAELPDKIKKKVKQHENVTEAGRVGVLIPDPGYVEPFLVLTEARRESSFAWTPDPETSPDAPLPPLITGAETYYRTDRSAKNQAQYDETTSEYSSQNSGFRDNVYKVFHKRGISGQIPQAQTRKRDWEQKQAKRPPADPLGGAADKKKKYFLTSDRAQDRLCTNPPESLSFPAAQTLKEALKAAETQLRLQGIQESSESKTLAWYHPDIQLGTAVRTGKDAFAGYGTWRVVSCSWQLEFGGESRGQKLQFSPLCQTEGTQIVLGLDLNRTLDVREEERDPDDRAGGSNPDDPAIVTTLVGGKKQLGRIELNRPNRRKF